MLNPKVFNVFSANSCYYFGNNISHHTRLNFCKKKNWYFVTFVDDSNNFQKTLLRNALLKNQLFENDDDDDDGGWLMVGLR